MRECNRLVTHQRGQRDVDVRGAMEIVDNVSDLMGERARDDDHKIDHSISIRRMLSEKRQKEREEGG